MQMGSFLYTYSARCWIIHRSSGYGRVNMNKCYFVIIFLWGIVSSLLEEPLVAFQDAPGALEIDNAVILRDASDPIGVQIATDSLAEDMEEITGTRPQILEWDGERQPEASAHPVAIIAATVDSPLVSKLVAEGRAVVEDIQGKWETFRTAVVQSPLPGIEHALLITGSDKRGTMYGVFTLAEQMGKSP